VVEDENTNSKLNSILIQKLASFMIVAEPAELHKERKSEGTTIKMVASCVGFDKVSAKTAISYSAMAFLQ
jgi:hypothetical protein